MKITVTESARTLVAVIGIPTARGTPIFFRAGPAKSVMIDPGFGCLEEPVPLEFVAKEPGRTPVYKGDTITITF